MLFKIVLFALAVLVFSTETQNPIKCANDLDETMTRGGELCFYPHKVQFTENIRGRNIKFSFPIEDFKGILEYKTDEKAKYAYEEYFEVK